MKGMSVEKEYIRDGKITKMVIILVNNLESLRNEDFRERIFYRESKRGKRKIVAHGIEIDSTVPLFGERAKALPQGEFLHMQSKKSVADLIDLNLDGVFVVCGEVAGIVDEQEWWYLACKCHKGVVHVFSSCSKSCSFFVAQSKAKNSGPHPIKFDSLVGHRMLFAVDIALKRQLFLMVITGSREFVWIRKLLNLFVLSVLFPIHARFDICILIEIFGAIDLESHVDSYGSDGTTDVETMEFVKDFIVTAPITHGKDEIESDVPVTVKRNLSKVFDKVAKGKKNVALKKVK
ncbi:replication protein A 70 kDa DNA-binding subunit E [Trifolium repens]|nr:replication protein A 70 kDa DNA-binding subunit E [Trifolium repens]